MSGTAETVVCTTGTSLLTNLAPALRDFDDWLQRQPEADRDAVGRQRAAVVAAAKALQGKAWEKAGEGLAEIEGTPRLLGAELTSLAAMRAESPYSNLALAVLLHSDSEDGKGAAVALKAYMHARGLLTAELANVEALEPGNPSRFKIAGLRNLARLLAAQLRRAGDPSRMVVNATGGYKAQIAVAVVFGQVFGVRVVYQYEGFKDFIEFPPLPVQLDMSAVAENLDLLTEETVPEKVLAARFGPLKENNEAWARFRCFLEEERVPSGGSDYLMISPLAELALDRWRYSCPLTKPELPAAGKQAGPSWGSHHVPKGAREFVEGLLRECPWIARVESRDAEGRSHARKIAFRLSAQGELPDILCAYVADNHPALLAIKTTARTRRQQEDALRWLDDRFAAGR